MPMSPRLLRPRAAGRFDPRSIAGNVWWLDPSVSSSLTIQTGVAEWRNLNATVGGRLSQSVANNQPTLTNDVGAPATINGLQGIYFDGSNDLLESPPGAGMATSLNGAPGGSLYVVVRPSRTTGSELFIVRNNNFGCFDLAYDTRLAINTNAGNVSFSPRFSSAVMSANVNNVLSVRFDAASGTSVGFRNRTAVVARGAVSGNTLTAFGASVPTISVGGIAALLSGKLQAVMGEVLCYARDISDAEHEAVLNYLMAKWGVA